MVFGVINSGLFIDILTLIIGFFLPNRKVKIHGKKPKLSIIIPAYNEEGNIERTIYTAFNQSVKPERVIIIDDNSNDKTYDICLKMKKKYKNLKVVGQNENRGKAYNVSYVLKNFRLSELVMVLDADTFLGKRFIEEIIKPFAIKRVAVVTGRSFPLKQSNFFGKIIYHGSIFQYKFFAFRKNAQSLRNAVSVISGDSSVYRTSFLREVGGLPMGTQTEDVDITWIALEKGYKIVFQGKAEANSKDAATFKGHWKQLMRWFSGSFQCSFRHGRKLLKAKPLLFTTLIPFYFDCFIYAPLFLFSWIFYSIYPTFVIGFYFADLLFTIVVVLFMDMKGLIRLPQIYFVKALWSIIWLSAFAKTSLQYLGGRRVWGGTWSRNDFYVRGKND